MLDIRLVLKGDSDGSAEAVGDTQRSLVAAL